MIKKIILVIWSIFIISIIIAPKAKAITAIDPSNSGGDVTIESNENIEDNVATVGNNVYIRGIINDDLFVAGSNIKIEGEIKGNLFAAGNIITINGKVDKDTYLLGNTISIENNASIGKDLLIGGNLITIGGNIGRNIMAGATRIDIEGTVKGNANISSSSLNIDKNANIDGTLRYSGNKELSNNETSQVKGEITYEKPEKTQAQVSTFSTKAVSWLYSLVSFLFVGIILILFLPKWFEKVSDITTEQTLKSIGTGFLILVTTPIIAVIALVTLIGIPITLITTLIYIFIFYIAKYWIAYCIGRIISKSKWSPILTIIVGIIILQVVFIIPIIGGLASFIVMLAGAGAVWLAKPLQSAK